MVSVPAKCEIPLARVAVPLTQSRKRRPSNRSKYIMEINLMPDHHIRRCHYSIVFRLSDKGVEPLSSMVPTSSCKLAQMRIRLLIRNLFLDAPPFP